MTDIEKAVAYIMANPTLSFHAVAVEFNVDVSEFSKAYQIKYNEGKK